MPRFERMDAQDRSPVLFLDQLLAGAARDVGEDQIRRVIGDDGVDLDLPAREVDAPIDFTSVCAGTW